MRKYSKPFSTNVTLIWSLACMDTTDMLGALILIDECTVTVLAFDRTNAGVFLQMFSQSFSMAVADLTDFTPIWTFIGM